MSKATKIALLKVHLAPIMDKIIVSNDAEYGGRLTTGMSPLASLGGALAGVRLRKVGTTTPVTIDWLNMGRDLYEKRSTAKKDSLNCVCDTLAAYALYVLNNFINFHGRFELFNNPAPTHHHFVVVDRATGSDAGNSTTWGDDCFVIDLWHAKRDTSIKAKAEALALLRRTPEPSTSQEIDPRNCGIFSSPAYHLYSDSGMYRTVAEREWNK